MRDILLDRLKQDVVGPYAADEVLTARPTDVYLTGVLWPHESRMGAEEDERFDLSGALESETDGGGEEEEVSLVGLVRPCSASVSFAAKSEMGHAGLRLTVSFAIYKPVATTVTETGQSEQGGRRAHDIAVDGVKLKDASWFVDLEPLGAPPGVRQHNRTALWPGGTLATVTMLNQADPDEDEGR